MSHRPRLFLLIGLLVGLMLLSGLARAASSYTFRSDSYAWETAATAIAWDRNCTNYPGDDDKATINFTGGFKFRFAGTDHTSVRVLANGGLQFGGDTGFHRTYTNTALPAGTPGSVSGCTASATTNVILAYWTDLNPSQSGSGGVTWQQKGTAPNRYVVVSWNGVYQYNTSTPYTFQIILYESAAGVNGEFKFQYGNANATGSRATIGVQVDGSDFTQYSYNSGYNANGSAIRWFVPSGTPTRRAEYRFDEWAYSGRIGEVADSSGNSNNGVRVGSATTSPTARVCRSLSVPANTSATSDAVDTLLDVNSAIGDKGAVTLWYRAATAWNSGAAMLLDGTTSTARPFFLVRQADGSLRFTVTDSNGLVVTAVTQAQSVLASNWRHVAITWKLASGSNQSVLRIYIGGSQVGATTTTTSGTLDNSIGTLFVGDNRSSTAPANATLNSANGLIDEMRVYNYEISALELTADQTTPVRTCLPPLDHYEVSVPATSLTCMPTAVTVKACSTNAATCSVETSVNGTARLTTNAGTLSSTLLNFSNGVATATLTLPGGADGTTASLELDNESLAAANPRECCPDGASCYPANSCPTTFKRAGFIVATATGGNSANIPSQIAGTTSGAFYLRAVRSSSTTQACESALSGNTSINWAYQCSDPATCSGSNLMHVEAGTSGGGFTGSPVAIQRNNNGTTLSYSSVPMYFDANGNALFRLRFDDVGQTTLNFNRTVSVGGGSDLINGSSNAFVTRPFGFAVTNIASGAKNNPAAANDAGGAFVAAGASFGARITAVTSGGNATPNFGKEAAPEGVRLTPALVLPSPGTAGALNNATVAGAAFTNGVANVNNLAYTEVGIITLTPSVADGDYLGAGAVSGAATGNVGRFIPAGFTVDPGTPTHRSDLACSPASTFTYLDENFKLGFTLKAVNAAGIVTSNYAGSFAKLALGAHAGFNLAGISGATKFAGRVSASASTGTWAGGTAVVALTAKVERGASVDGPFNAPQFGIAPVDADGVAMTAFDLDTDAVAGNDHTQVHTGQIPLRYGRLRLQNALSAANRALKLPLTAQSWNGNAFVTNALDSCTTVTAANLSFGNFRKTLTSSDAVMSPAAVTVNPTLPVYLTLAAPGGGRLGSMDVAVALGATTTDSSCLKTSWTPAKPATAGANLTGLRGAWCGTAATSDPSARATWGLYRGSDGVVFQQENY
jgi:MSHA biogenesis protein MshQ